jgi:hypothetical protein
VSDCDFCGRTVPATRPATPQVLGALLRCSECELQSPPLKLVDRLGGLTVALTVHRRYLIVDANGRGISLSLMDARALVGAMRP